jgi:hypothetical protein
MEKGSNQSPSGGIWPQFRHRLTVALEGADALFDDELVDGDVHGAA